MVWTTTGWTALWGARSRHRCRVPFSTGPTRGRRHGAGFGSPSYREGGDEPQDGDEARPGAARDSLPEVRMRALRGHLYEEDPRWCDSEAAGMPALREKTHYGGASAMKLHRREPQENPSWTRRRGYNQKLHIARPWPWRQRVIGLNRRRRVDWVLGKIQLATAFAIVAFGASLKADIGKFEPVPVVARSLEWMQKTAWIIVVAGPILVATLQWARLRFGSPWAWEAIQKLLDEFRNDVFGDFGDDPLDHHRVTLFKYSKFKPSFSTPKSWMHWLVAVARSDHLTKLRIRRFRAPDDGESCEGVVGRAWRCSSWVLVPKSAESLPVLDQQSPDADIERYASETGVEPTWVRSQLLRGRPLARSYAALLVRLKGQPWGVLVLDSRNEARIDVTKLDRFKAYGNLLTPLLERV